MRRKLPTIRNRNRFSGAQYALSETRVHHQMNDDTPAFVSFMPVSARCSPSDGGVCGHKQGRYVLSVVNVGRTDYLPLGVEFGSGAPSKTKATGT